MPRIHEIPEYSIIRAPNGELGVLHLNGTKNNRTGFMVTSNGRTIELTPDRDYLVIATPYDLANRFLNEVEGKLVLDSCMDRARSLSK